MGHHVTVIIDVTGIMNEISGVVTGIVDEIIKVVMTGIANEICRVVMTGIVIAIAIGIIHTLGIGSLTIHTAMGIKMIDTLVRSNVILRTFEFESRWRSSPWERV